MRGYVELFQVGKTYETKYGPQVIVENFDLNIQKGKFVSLLGHSGCGKSTILTMIAGLNTKTAGDIVVAGKEIKGPGPDRGVVFQSPCLLPWMTALENILLGVSRVYPQASKPERLELCSYYLSLVGLGDSFKKTPRELSLGMQQRVGLARALALSPKVLLLDEPFGMLDSLTRMELQETLCLILEQDQRTAMMVTHDVDEALFLSDEIIMMTNGPRATVGDLISVPFERPRRRGAVLAHPDYYDLRGRMLNFLEEQEHRKVA